MKINGVNKENRRFIMGASILNVPAGCVNLGEKGIKRIYTDIGKGSGGYVSYLSGQFIKAKIKDRLEEQGEELSIPVIVQVKDKKNTPTTSCNPFKYIDDDLFGYMNVIPSDDKDKIDNQNKGTTRVGSFKISYYLGRKSDLTKDYGVKRNGALKDGNLTTMPLDDDTRLFATTHYSGCFCIDLNCSGRFFKRNISGWKNISDKFPTDKYKEKILRQDEFEIVLKPEIRTERVQKLIEALPYLSGGAKMSTIYTDIAPKFIIFCITNSGNNIFQEVSTINETLNINALKEGLIDYKDTIKSNIYLAKRNGFMDEKCEDLMKFINEYNETNKDGFKIICNEDLSGINDITKRFSKEVLSKIYYETEGI